MKVVIQRVKKGRVSVSNKLINEIDKGYVILVGFHVDDNLSDIDYIVRKIINLRVFDDEMGVMNKSIIDVKGKILSISQFTLQANTKEGNRPSYINAMKGDTAINMYNLFNDKLKGYVDTLSGVFGADMQVDICNDGPVTIVIDSHNK